MAAKQLVPAITSGAYITLSASIFSNYVEIQEDGTGAAAGLKVKFPSDNFTAVYEYPPSQQPIKIGVPENTGAAGAAPLAGKPSRTVQVPKGSTGTYLAVTEPATVYCQVESMGATTIVRIDERP